MCGPAPRALALLAALRALLAPGLELRERGRGYPRGAPRKLMEDVHAPKGSWKHRRFWQQRKTCVADVNTGGEHCSFISQEFCTGINNTLAFVTGPEAGCLKTVWNTCAIVGSSSHLLDTRFGDEIDLHDMVIRMNQAPDGHADPRLRTFVGSRTGVRFANGIAAESGLANLSTAACTFYHEPPVHCKGRRTMCSLAPDRCTNCQPTELFCYGSAGQRPRAGAGQPPPAAILDHVHAGIARRFLGVAQGASQAFRPTAGFTALAYALHHCRRLSVYGFGPSCNGSVGGRYYDNGVEVHTHHTYFEELELMKRMSSAEGGPADAVLEEARPWILTDNVTLRVPDCLANWTIPQNYVKRKAEYTAKRLDRYHRKLHQGKYGRRTSASDTHWVQDSSDYGD